MSAFYRAISRSFRTTTIVELVVLVAILALLIALIVPGAQWASSGSILFPVRVLVFDASHGVPISEAHVVIFRAPLLLDSNSLEKSRDRYDPTNFDQISENRDGFGKGITGADGTVVIEFDFRTGASHKRPKVHAHLGNAWVYVQADGFGGVVVPVRQDFQSTAAMREQKELLVPVGLVPVR